MNEVIKIETTKKEKPKVYHLCSEGNRKIIQSSNSEKKIKEATTYLNNLCADYEGIYREKFYYLKSIYVK